ncbi:MAG: phosphohydrolase [Zetaproteobacteria bacterium CG12_big_fil_rev_8_21_14_0_65_54_13]|nr:MAG: phosphohydrolase [Zetaproteobacteria bacterium CG12_big_fil_rev_8_21_14_0_65_54_13]PIX55221.1 MAG: phosphohydrolase [Zetaproteobacteria bacterium CG_4_10_14_3_um_filter_54_28]PJA28104.1 MAG: phosphohydrolase [Zetaproteobacteria bacterium CG_4_9_14_3_um_filter_54_145]
MPSSDNVYEALFKYTKALTVALGYRDSMTRLHSDRVRSISMLIGKHLGLVGDDYSALKMGSSFHDIGKIGIPDTILLKPASLDADEWKEMKRHSEYGEAIIAASGFEGSDRAAKAIRHHHEHFDGGGYPDGLAGSEIPLCSRIMALADSYDAMAVTRSYHRARNHQEIMSVMLGERGTKFEPRLFEAFCECIERSPMKVR